MSGKRKRTDVGFSRSEVRLILKVFEDQPKDFDSILRTIDNSCSKLSPEHQAYYQNEENRKILETIRDKIKLLSTEDLAGIEDVDLRMEEREGSTSDADHATEHKRRHTDENVQQPSCSNTTTSDEFFSMQRLQSEEGDGKKSSIRDDRNRLEKAKQLENTIIEEVQKRVDPEFKQHWVEFCIYVTAYIQYRILKESCDFGQIFQDLQRKGYIRLGFYQPIINILSNCDFPSMLEVKLIENKIRDLLPKEELDKIEVWKAKNKKDLYPCGRMYESKMVVAVQERIGSAHASNLSDTWKDFKRHLKDYLPIVDAEKCNDVADGFQRLYIRGKIKMGNYEAFKNVVCKSDKRAADEIDYYQRIIQDILNKTGFYESPIVDFILKKIEATPENTTEKFKSFLELHLPTVHIKHCLDFADAWQRLGAANTLEQYKECEDTVRHCDGTKKDNNVQYAERLNSILQKTG